MLIRRIASGLLLAVLSAGCFALLDFDGYDTRLAPAPGAADASSSPFTIALAPSSVTEFAGAHVAIHVTIARVAGFTGAIAVSLASDGGATLSSPDPTTGDAIDVDLVVAGAQGPHDLALTATSPAAPGFEAPATLHLVVAGAHAGLDPSFADGGVFELAPPARALGIAVAQDDTAFVVGMNPLDGGLDAFVLHLRSDGTLDPSYANLGFASLLGPRDTSSACVGLSLDGQLYVALSDPTGAQINALDIEGTRNPSFDSSFAPVECRAIVALPDLATPVVVVGASDVYAFGLDGARVTSWGKLVGATLASSQVEVAGAVLRRDNVVALFGTDAKRVVVFALDPKGVVTNKLAGPLSAAMPGPVAPARARGAALVLPYLSPDAGTALASLFPDGGLDPAFGTGGIAGASGQLGVLGGDRGLARATVSTGGTFVFETRSDTGAVIASFDGAGTDLARVVPVGTAIDGSGRAVVLGQRPSGALVVLRFWL